MTITTKHSIFFKNKLNKKGIKNVKLIKKDITQVSSIAELGKFDMIILIDVIEHLDIIYGMRLIASFKKFLNPKGKIVIITPNYAGFWPIIERYIIYKFTHIPHF